MLPALQNTIICISFIILVILLILIYRRSRQGDQRIIQVTNQMFLRLLSAIVLTIGVLYTNETVAQCTQGIPNILRYVAAIGAVLIIALGFLRYALSQNRDRRLITHPVLFAIMLVLIIFAVVQVIPCICRLSIENFIFTLSQTT